MRSQELPLLVRRRLLARNLVALIQLLDCSCCSSYKRSVYSNNCCKQAYPRNKMARQLVYWPPCQYRIWLPWPP
uniref:Putative secreted protein n=1 Tax=Xenopsylla cheopis TaxID=163159 RepID=A0A6M2DZ59_XENCH